MAKTVKKAQKGTKRKPLAAGSSALSVAKRKKGVVPDAIASGKKGDGGSLFEKQWTKSKFEILGRKRKSEGRRVGLSRSVAIDKRKKTILQEFQNRGKANVFLDHRFGEKDEDLAEADKAILRFQRERQAQWQKKSRFTLQDEDEETILTHGGMALSELDDFDDNSLDEREEDEKLDAELVKNFHFGGDSTNKSVGTGDVDEKKPKSKKEIMEEIIAKSKFYKAQKAKEKEEDMKLKEQLDKDFAELAKSQALTSLVRLKKSMAIKSRIIGENNEKVDDFDKLVKEMGMEMKAHASDRLKTDEEIAEEERAQLEELEEKRRKRMHGVESSDDSGSEDEDAKQSSQMKKRQRIEQSGDDLGENFVVDDDQPKRGWVDEVLARKEEEEENEDSESEGNESSGEEDYIHGDSIDSDYSGDVQEFTESDSDDHSDKWEESDDEELKNQEKAQKDLRQVDDVNISSMEGAKLNHSTHADAVVDFKAYQNSELPFVIDAPKNLDEFRSLVDGRPIEELLTAIQRIRMCNSIRLAAENRRKMQVFYGVVLQYFASVASGVLPCMDKLNVLVKPLLEMSSETPYFSAICAREWIIKMREQFVAKLKDPGVDDLWPSRKTLALWRLWSLTFPPSDFRHAVLTPCTLLMAEHLIRSQVKSARDLAIGTFICGQLLSIMRPARRFCPEALSFLYAALGSALPMKLSMSNGANFLGCGSFMLELVSSQPWLRLKDDCSNINCVADLEFEDVCTAAKDAPFFNSDQLSFVRGRNYDPDKERAERKKLNKLLKQEAKGAARELRKDNYFLQIEKVKEKEQAAELREEEYRKAMNFLQEQEAAFKSGQLGKGKGRRRRK
ncbi:hypothetical protein KP509_29G019800 [Ceratopteris richardii]|uniref:Nucleolar protein 14 n=2 Tax=Ceratopteris richardii TaxID=49495 RepID=A0A8T2R6T1_CERRI|nr:hypothetical protein KP509_29G019800 [Ceratopteris richardii]